MRAPLPDAAALKAAAEPLRTDVVAFLQDLVRIPSVNGRDGEAGVAERIAQESARLGLVAHLVPAGAGRPNAVVRWGDGASGFVLVGHMDTVTEGDARAWTAPPLGAEIREGRLIGRGAADNKAGIACALYTLALLRELGVLDPNDVRVTLAGVVDEESGASSPLGVRYLLDQELLQPAEGAIYTYASDIVCIGHRGLLRAALQARGQAIHSGSPLWARGQGGVNAVTGLAEVLLDLERLHISAPPHPAFGDMGCTLTPGTIFRGGEFESMVPARAEALIDVRLMPGQDSQKVLAEMQRVITGAVARRPGLAIDVAVKNDLPGAAIRADHPLALCAQAYARAITGAQWPIAGAGPANEGYMLIGAGIPTLCGFGPTGGNAHAPDEWVELDSLTDTIAIYAGIIQDTLLHR
jgi:succinyl-diaminopimelate desuccinylase